MSKFHWTAEETRKGWGIRYNPTPGGVKKADGTTSFSLSFIALELTDMVSEAETAAKAIAHELNCHADLLEALRAAKAFHDRDEGCNGFTADYECLRLQIDNAIARAEGR